MVMLHNDQSQDAAASATDTRFASKPALREVTGQRIQCVNILR